MKANRPLYREQVTANKKELHGVGGWLLFFCLNLTVLVPIENADQLLQYLSAESDPLQLIMVIAFSGVPIVYGIVVGIQIWLIVPNALRYVKIYLIISLCINLLEAGLIAIAKKGIAPIMLPILRGIVPFSIWWIYFAKSIRVKNTYAQSNNPEKPQDGSNEEEGHQLD